MSFGCACFCLLFCTKKSICERKAQMLLMPKKVVCKRGRQKRKAFCINNDGRKGDEEDAQKKKASDRNCDASNKTKGGGGGTRDPFHPFSDSEGEKRLKGPEMGKNESWKRGFLSISLPPSRFDKHRLLSLLSNEERRGFLTGGEERQMESLLRL